MNSLPSTFVNEQITILVVDDNLDEIAELCEAIDNLGHHVKGAESVRSALHVLEQDRSIKIVITDIRMDGLDGFDLLAEIDARYGNSRPITKIVASGYQEYDYALEAMRLGAIDIIKKPCSASTIKASIRRALILQSHRQGIPLTTGERAFGGEAFSVSIGQHSDRMKLIKDLQKQRTLRSDLIECDAFSDPAWDIFLDLSAAHYANQQVSVSSACAATDAPFSTALRYVNRIVEANLAIRYDDPNDKRRNLIALSELGQQRIQAYLTQVQDVFPPV